MLSVSRWSSVGAEPQCHKGASQKERVNMEFLTFG